MVTQINKKETFNNLKQSADYIITALKKDKKNKPCGFSCFS